MFVLLCASLSFGQVTSRNYLPSSTGQDLGSADQRWDGYFQNVDIKGVITCNGGGCSLPPIDESTLVHKTGDETIAGNKTFGTTVLPLWIDIRAYGANGNGVADNCTAITNAAAACSNQTLYVPKGTFNTSCSIAVPLTCDLKIDGTLKATASMDSLLKAGTNADFWDRKALSGKGTLDGNQLATNVLWLRSYRQNEISEINISGIAASGAGIYLGDTAGSSLGGYAAQIHDIQWGQHSASTQTGSICFVADTNTGDTKFYNSDPHGCSIGVKDYVGGSRYINLHAWDQNMTVCFDDIGNGTFWGYSQCDTPSQYGWHIHGFGAHIISNRAYYFGTGADNVATAFYFDQPDPNVVMMDTYFQGTTGHRWAADTNLATINFTTGLDYFYGTLYAGVSVVTKTLGSTATVPSIVSLLQSHLVQGYYQTRYAVTSSATPVFHIGFGTHQKLVLSQNVASSTVDGVLFGSAPSWGQRAITTIEICQPSAGGPYTFVWPTNTIGGGTIGTTADKCSYQTFQWDEQNLTALGPMMQNGTTVGGVVPSNTAVNGRALSSDVVIPSFMVFSTGASGITQATTGYVGVSTAAFQGVEARVYFPVPAAMTLQNLYCVVDASPAASQTIAFTIRTAGTTDSALTCTITGNSATTCNDTTHTAALSAGGLIDLKIITSATSGTLRPNCSVQAY